MSQEGPSILRPAVQQLHYTLQHGKLSGSVLSVAEVVFYCVFSIDYHPCSVPWLSTTYQDDVLATVIQYCLLISPSRQLQVPIEDIINVICLAASKVTLTILLTLIIRSCSLGGH